MREDERREEKRKKEEAQLLKGGGVTACVSGTADTVLRHLGSASGAGAPTS